MIIWLFGQEVDNGTEMDIMKFVFRRTPVVRGKALQKAKDRARELTELFARIGIEETAGKQ